MKLTVLVLCMCICNAVSRAPNILFLLADDLGYGEPELYPAPTSPHGRISTPNINKFGETAMRFYSAYAGYTVCAPSRMALMTGRHSGHVKPPLLADDANITIPHILSTLGGYHTALVGKWGLGDLPDPGYPRRQGFDHFYGQMDQSKCHNMYPNEVQLEYDVINVTINFKPKSRELCMANPSAYNYSDLMFHNHAMQYITDRATKHREQPWYLFMSYTIPHAGGWTFHNAEQGQPVPSDGQYAGKGWKDVEKDHASVITTVLDWSVGQILGRLEELGIENDTVVFFASDNGAHNEGGHSYKYFDSSGPLQGFKRSLYEGGVRSATQVRWPGVTTPNTTSEYAWAFWDFLPTAAELAGVDSSKLPTNLDGISIVPTLKGEKQAPKDYLYFTWGGGYGVRMDKWKGVLHKCGGDNPPHPGDKKASKLELYDLSKDIGEKHNLADRHPDIVKQLMMIPIDNKCTCKQAPNFEDDVYITPDEETEAP